MKHRKNNRFPKEKRARFALFTVLSLAQRIINKSVFSLSWNSLNLCLLVTGYVLIWIFGLYSWLNFCYYSTVAHLTERKLVGGMERELVTEYKATWKGISKRFASFKVPDEPQNLIDKALNLIRSNNEGIAVCVYVAIGFLPLAAFLIWFFLT
jgi:hypothetical protein